MRKLSEYPPQNLSQSTCLLHQVLNTYDSHMTSHMITKCMLSHLPTNIEIQKFFIQKIH